MNNSNSSNTINELSEYLAYCTRIASFKSDSDYLPFLGSFIIKKEKSLNETISAHLKENVSVHQKMVSINDIVDDFLNFFDFLKNKKYQLGIYSGTEIYENIKNEGEEFVKLAEDLTWYKLESDTNLSYSSFGNVYYTKLVRGYFVLDFGHSD
jgi:hypothetical protein